MVVHIFRAKADKFLYLNVNTKLKKGALVFLKFVRFQFQ